jgi:IS5 family transposase
LNVSLDPYSSPAEAQAPQPSSTIWLSVLNWLETMVGRVRQVVRQTKIPIFVCDTNSPGKIVSVFEPHTEIIRKGKASKPNELGKLVKIQEARLERIPRTVAADVGFYSRENEKAGQDLGER